jgi:hypothetical protein
MNPSASDLVPLILYSGIGIGCLFLALKGLKTRQLIFKRGTKGTGLENSVPLIWAQIIGTFILAVGMLAYALLYAYFVFLRL